MIALLLVLAAQAEPPVKTPTETAATETAPTETVPAAETPTPAPTPAPTKPAPTTCTLAVLELEAGDAVAPARAKALSDVVTAEVSALTPCTVLSRADIRGVLSFEAEKQLMGCASDSCMAELADALGADYLVTGTLSRIEGSALLSLRNTNMKTLKVERRATDALAGDDADAIAFVGYVARKLMTDDPAKIGPRPVARPQIAAAAPRSTVWRPLFWTSLALTGVGAVVAGGAGGATVLMAESAKSNATTAAQLQDVGPVVADVANVSVYATAGLAVATVVFFFLPAEEAP